MIDRKKLVELTREAFEEFFDTDEGIEFCTLLYGYFKRIVPYQFESVLLDAHGKYVEKKKQYADTWKDMPIEKLRARFTEEVNELHNTLDRRQEYNELLDVINIACMLAERARRENENVQILRT